MADVEMKDASSTTQTSESTEQVATPPKPPVDLVADELNLCILLTQKAANSKESRFLVRVLRKTASLRHKLTIKHLRQVILTNTPSSVQKDLIGFLSKVSTTEMETDDSSQTEKKEEAKQPPEDVLPEVEAYIHLLVTIFLIDKKQYNTAIECSSSLIQKIQPHNRRTLFPLGAQAFFYFSRSYELVDRLEDIRGTLIAAHRTASLRHDDEGQATILNLLLRNYLHYNLYDQAFKLVSKTTFPEGSASGSQYARYLYYQGRIKSIQLEYTDAYRCLVQAIRKAPQSSARGFRETVYKLLCIVQLLMGEIPERSIFRQAGLKGALKPYLQLTQAVRVGDLAAFHEVVDQFGNLFRKDKTYTLIQRLRQNVIKTGLRKINMAYSRISLADICSKLHLDSVEDAEFIVAKAIRDDVIDATINHEGGYVQSKETIDIYTTHEPMEAFHKRISFCLNIRNEAVKAMRFPPDAHKPNKEPEEVRKERLKHEQELAKNLAEEDDDDDEF